VPEPAPTIRRLTYEDISNIGFALNVNPEDMETIRRLQETQTGDTNMPITINQVTTDEEPEFDAICAGCENGMYDGDYSTSDYDGRRRCDACHDEHSDYYAENNHDDENELTLIHNYGHKPRPIFHSLKENGETYWASSMDPTQMFMGFELEVESTAGRTVAGAEWVISKLGDVAYLKEDGSINNGFEIVTHPCTLAYYMNNFDWKGISKLKSYGFESWNTSTCGLHIHVGRKSFVSDIHQWKFLYFIYKNKQALVKFAGRQSTYANFSLDNFLNGHTNWNDNESVIRGDKLMDMAKGQKVNQQRYCAANLQSRNTIELRFFKPSLNVKTVQACLQFCDALFEYTKVLTTYEAVNPILRGLYFDTYHSWVKLHNTKYPELVSTIDKRLGTSVAKEQ